MYAFPSMHASCKFIYFSNTCFERFIPVRFTGTTVGDFQWLQLFAFANTLRKLHLLLFFGTFWPALHRYVQDLRKNVEQRAWGRPSRALREII